jgi:diguanylate cyclase (GGDEF)-like protein
MVAMLLPVIAVVASGMASFRSSIVALEQFREETVEEATVIEGLRDRLTNADDVGEDLVEELVESGTPPASEEFRIVSQRIDADFDELATMDGETERRLVVEARGAWDLAVVGYEDATQPSDESVDDRLDPFHDDIDIASSILADLHSYQGTQVANEIRSLRAREQTQLLTAIGVLVAGLVLAGALAWRLRRSITRPLHELETAAATFGADDFAHRVVVSGDDELARVGSAFNSMAAKLQKSRAELEHHALHDGLTGLPNRVLFMERLEHALARAHRRQSPVSVLYVDLDDFKTVNDTLGHEAGDKLLIACTERLLTCVRAEDTVARLGGDEFGILLEDTGENAAAAAERITRAFRSIWPIATGQVAVKASVGVATLSGEGEVDQLLRQADAAMYAAKARGKGTWQMFGRDLNADVLQAQTISSELAGAIERRELVAHYQPLIDIDTGAIEGVEALVRWNHPDRGLLGPSEFLEVAEQSGQILDIDAWMLRQACTQVRAWQRESDSAADLYVSVNLSAQQLHHPRLAEQVADALETSGLAPRHLILEITESAFIHDTQAATVELAQVKELGVRLALDDFGTGYSSLSHLLRFPIDIIKIDRSFVSAIGGEDTTSELALGLVTLARTMSLQTVAEGVDDEEHLLALQQVRCESAQGFYFAPALPPDEMATLLRARIVGPDPAPPLRSTARGDSPGSSEPDDHVRAPASGSVRPSTPAG